ncbi:hypothetical protein [Paraburkholderia kururiensis]|nr:hypothetical protein [Paraburkholderia kururiensis]
MRKQGCAAGAVCFKLTHALVDRGGDPVLVGKSSLLAGHLNLPRCNT